MLTTTPKVSSSSCANVRPTLRGKAAKDDHHRQQEHGERRYETGFIEDCLLYVYARSKRTSSLHRLPPTANTLSSQRTAALRRVRLPPRPGLDPARVEAVDDHHGDQDHRANGNLVVGKDT